MQLTSKTILFLIGTAALLPLLGLAAWLWRRFYRDDEGNTARRVLRQRAANRRSLVNKAVDFGFAAITLRALGFVGQRRLQRRHHNRQPIPGDNDQLGG